MVGFKLALLTGALFGAGLASASQDPEIWGFESLFPGNNATGGRGAPSSSIYTVTNFSDFKTAINNKGKPHEPKIIYINGTISGNYLANGQVTTEAHYANGTVYTWANYIDSFNQTLIDLLTASTNPADKARLNTLKLQEPARHNSSLVQAAQITIKVGNNTSIIGHPKRKSGVARLEDIALLIKRTNNVIVQDLEIYTPIDLFPEWDPKDGSAGNWNSQYDAIGVITSTNVWFDHLTISDGRHPDSEAPIIFGKKVQRHDGAIDIAEGSDLVTMSHCLIHNHDKTHLVGNSDANGPDDIGRLRVSFYANAWVSSIQRSPRLRFGKAHLFNNYYNASLNDEKEKLQYCSVLSEANVFEITTSSNTTHATDAVIGQFKGYRFKDNQSWVNGTSVDLEAVAKTKYDTAKAAEVAAAAAAGRAVAQWATFNYTNEVFKPDYFYRLKKTEEVKEYVLANAGVGKLKL
ncbi:Pectate lyase/Amb allergen [Ceratobasidium theobromae]|uniref:Pectate lyase/Amb allergen n=1 Tax=Ceratobasidium theobromae TaxID=1582974 RepID=A0A5N5QNX0_9AGAM|nr:Pectate lyase/Amb allergen [Ceratobasidium theobromae]